MSQFDRKTIFTNGQVITLDSNELKFVKKLSSGFTGEVYKAILTNPIQERVDVAVKLMKEVDFAKARELFFKEAETLRFLMDYEKESNITQRTDIKTAPTFYFLEEYDNRPYIVMEYISGVEIPTYLDEKIKIPESNALVLGWHLFRILNLLHSKIEKTFIDLKFENLWIEEKEHGKLVLRLTDFGTLEEITETGVKRDILLGGVYLFEMLTGQKLNYSFGELLENADTEIEKSNLSWGVKELLYRLLHRNPNARFSNAGEVAGNLRFLANFWDQNVEQIVEIGRNNYSKASEIKHADPTDEKISRYCKNAKSAFSIATIKDPLILTEIEFDVENVDNLLSLGNYLDRGKILFESGSYALAYDVFLEGKNVSRNPQQLRRWGYLAGLGKDILPDKFSVVVDDLKMAIKYHCDGLYQLAKEKYLQIGERIISSNLKNLINDCDLFINLLEGENLEKDKDYEKAALKYRIASEKLAQITDWQFIIKEETGNLAKKADHAEILANSIQKIEVIINEANEFLQEKEFEKSWEILNQVFRFRMQDKQILERLIMFAEEYLRNHKYNLSFTLSDNIIASWGRAKSQELGWIRRISRLMTKLIDYKNLEDYLSMLRILDENKDLLTNEYVKDEVLITLKDVFSQAVVNENIFLIQEFNDSFILYFPDNFRKEIKSTYAELKIKVEKKNNRFSRELIKQAYQLIECELSSESVNKFSFTELLKIICDNQTRLEKARDLLKRANLFEVDRNNSVAINSLMKTVEEKIENLEENKTIYLDSIEMRRVSRSETIERDYKEIIDYLDNLEKVDGWKFVNEENEEITSKINNFINENIRDLYIYGIDDFGIEEKLMELVLKIDKNAPYTWEKLTLQESIREHEFTQKLENIREQLNTGSIEESINSLIELDAYKLKSLEWLQLKKISALVISNNLFLDKYENSSRASPYSDMEIIYHLRRMLIEKMPKVYIERYPVGNWIKKIKEKEISWIVNHANSLSDNEIYYEHIGNLLRITEVENLMTKIGISGGKGALYV